MDELGTRFKKWLYAIKHLDRLDRVPDKFREQVFEKFFEVAEIANFSPEEVIRYEDSLKYHRDLKNVLDTARGEGLEQGIDIGREQGIDIGREQGIDIGREQGIDIGREQGIDIGRIQEKMDTAAKMLARGLDVQSVMDITGLSREDIEKL